LRRARLKELKQPRVGLQIMHPRHYRQFQFIVGNSIARLADHVIRDCHSCENTDKLVEEFNSVDKRGGRPNRKYPSAIGTRPVTDLTLDVRETQQIR
jgi:hypothetical protein